MRTVWLGQHTAAVLEVEDSDSGCLHEVDRDACFTSKRASRGHGRCSYACPYCNGECVRQFDHAGDHQCQNGHNW
jgi:hypothetical protein